MSELAPDQTWELLRDAATGWEPGPGPFTVPLPVVNRIVNFLHETSGLAPAPQVEPLDLRRAAKSLVDALDYEPGSLIGGKIALVRAALHPNYRRRGEQGRFLPREVA